MNSDQLAALLSQDPGLVSDLETYQAGLTGIAPDPTAPIPSPYATTVPLDGMGFVHMTPGAMGEFVSPAGTTIDMIVDGTGHFTSFASSDDSIMSNLALNNDIGLNTSSGYLLGTGTITLNVSWVDQYGNEQSSSITVVGQ